MVQEILTKMIRAGEGLQVESIRRLVCCMDISNLSCLCFLKAVSPVYISVEFVKASRHWVPKLGKERGSLTPWKSEDLTLETVQSTLIHCSPFFLLSQGKNIWFWSVEFLVFNFLSHVIVKPSPKIPIYSHLGPWHQFSGRMKIYPHPKKVTPLPYTRTQTPHPTAHTSIVLM